DDHVLAGEGGRGLTGGVRRGVVERATSAQWRLADADHLNRLGAGEPRVAAEERDTVRLEQLTDTVVQVLHDRVFALEDSRVIQTNVVGEDAEVRAVLYGLE